MVFKGTLSVTLRGIRNKLRPHKVSKSHLSHKSATPRVNQLGIQYISEPLHRKIFPKNPPDAYLKPENPNMVEMAKDHLRHNDLLGKKTQITAPIDIPDFPNLVGSSLNEHFYRIGAAQSEPYLSMAEELFSQSLPPPPKKWVFESGWTRYEPGKAPQAVDAPLEDALVFDVEVMYKLANYPTMATCASTTAWYGWVSPFLVDQSQGMNHLIPMNLYNSKRLLVGYNVSYDRARVQDEYNFVASDAFFLDAMSLHVAVAGICSQQRISWQQHRKIADSEDDSDVSEANQQLVDDPWLEKGSLNSLAAVAEFHCNIELDKEERDAFGTEDPQTVVDNFANLMLYCARDVTATFCVAKKLFPEFRKKVPHPTSFAALRHMGSYVLPTTRKWERYIESAERVYKQNRDEVLRKLHKIANDLVAEAKEKQTDFSDDVWLSQLNWEIKQPRLKKDGTPTAKQAYLCGYPEWYRDLCKTQKTLEDGTKQREMNLNLRTRITPLLLKLRWENYPVIWTDTDGWCFQVPFNEEEHARLLAKNYKEVQLTEDLSEILHDRSKMYFKVPHPDGGKRCTLMFLKGFTRYFDDGTLTSDYDYVLDIMALNNEALYWVGNRKRIMLQFVVYKDKENKKGKGRLDTEVDISTPGIIIPLLCVMGTITRRATENTWLTASSAKKNRIGSELKAMIEAPPGYVFVGADVDSEELWIALLVGDSVFGAHGSTALGWMTLEGDKNEGTDLHSKTAQILGILRNDAKVFNYGRIYGAGVKFATRLLKQCNTRLSDEEAHTIARDLYQKTKGLQSLSRFLRQKLGSGRSSRLYYGGTESVMFNALEAIAYQEDPRTPVLGAAITNALTVTNLNKNEYLTLRINWAIQSSGVDYLHLLIVGMKYLCDVYGVEARLAITVHDELRYLVREEDQYRAALLLQVSNLWTRAMFSEQMGIQDLPQLCAFFLEVDIDKVLRKEVTQPCVTPSNSDAIPPGRSLGISELLEIVKDDKFLKKRYNQIDLSTNYEPREPSLKSIRGMSTSAIEAMARLENLTSSLDFRRNDGVLCRFHGVDSFTTNYKSSGRELNKSEKSGNGLSGTTKKSGKSTKAPKMNAEVSSGANTGPKKKGTEKTADTEKKTNSKTTSKATSNTTAKTSAKNTSKTTSKTSATTSKTSVKSNSTQQTKRANKSSKSEVLASDKTSNSRKAVSTGSSMARSRTVTGTSTDDLKTVTSQEIEHTEGTKTASLFAPIFSPMNAKYENDFTMHIPASKPTSASCRRRPLKFSQVRLSNEVELGCNGTRELEEAYGKRNKWGAVRTLKVETVRPTRMYGYGVHDGGVRRGAKPSSKNH